MEDKWVIHVHVEYQSRERAIEQFEASIAQLKAVNYQRLAVGNSAANYYVRGPRPNPLTDKEIEQLRDLIR